MKKMIFLIAFTFYLNLGYSQKIDTIRIYEYETGIIRFKMITKNNKNFTFIDRHLLDTIRGSLIRKNERYSLFADTNKMDKRQKRFYKGLGNSIQFNWDKSLGIPLLKVAFDKSKWYYLDTTKISDSLTGIYSTSTGFVGCTIEVKGNGIIIFEPFSDMGGPESKDTAVWVKKGQSIFLKSNSFIDTWYTDNKKFFISPYYLIGKKIRKTKVSYMEEYTYFVKIPRDE